MARKSRYTGRYKLTKEQFLHAKYYALRYNEWQLEYASLADTARAITYSDMPKGSLNVDSPVEDAAIKCQILGDKIRLIERVAQDASGEFSPYILKAVTNEGITYNALRTLDSMPCGRGLFYRMRQRFYYFLAQRI